MENDCKTWFEKWLIIFPTSWEVYNLAPAKQTATGVIAPSRQMLTPYQPQWRLWFHTPEYSEWNVPWASIHETRSKDIPFLRISVFFFRILPRYLLVIDFMREHGVSDNNDCCGAIYEILFEHNPDVVSHRWPISGNISGIALYFFELIIKKVFSHICIRCVLSPMFSCFFVI